MPFGDRYCSRHHAYHDVEQESEQSGRNCYEAIGAELVAHAAILAAGGSDSGVGDEREVVAKEGTANYYSNKKGSFHSNVAGNFGSERCESHHSTHRCAYGDRNEASRDEDTGDNQLCGERLQRKSHGCINCTDAFGKGGKSTCKNENPYHI